MNGYLLGTPQRERSDAAHNRELLLATVREIIDSEGVDAVTMDGLAERAGVGKGTVFRRFGSRAGIFDALLDADERSFQARVLSGPPPLGPGADPVSRLIAYGEARIDMLLENLEIARAALGRTPTVPDSIAELTPVHVRALLEAAGVPYHDLGALALQLTAALEATVLLYTPVASAAPEGETSRGLRAAWRYLVDRVCDV